ncbi:MAG: DnaJ domain-containing protein [Oscillospiraceae bacterium]
MNDPYSTLGVDPNASDEEIKRAYRDLARKYHPDNYQNNPLSDLAEEKMKEINEAYDALQKRSSGGSYGGTAYQGSYQRSAASSNPLYAKVRSAINGGNLDMADRILQNEATTKDAEWFFLTGSVAYRKGWMDEAQQNYQLACQMDPGNMEYRQALNLMQQGGQAYRPYGYGAAARGPDACDCCSTLMCVNCLCGGGNC